MKQEHYKLAVISNVLAIITLAALGLIIGGPFKLHSEPASLLSKVVVISPFVGLLLGIIGLFFQKQRKVSAFGVVINSCLLIFLFSVFLELFR